MSTPAVKCYINSICSGPDKEKINEYLSVISERTVDGGNCIKFRNSFYMPVNSQGKDVFLESGAKVLVVETFDGSIYLNCCDELYRMRQLKDHSAYSREFDAEEPVKEKTS